MLRSLVQKAAPGDTRIFVMEYYLKEACGMLSLQALHVVIESFHTDKINPKRFECYLLTHQKMVRGGSVKYPMENTVFNHPSSSAVESAECMKKLVVQKNDFMKNQLILGSETFASTTLNEFEEDTYVNSSLHESIRHRAKKSRKYFKAEAAQASLMSSAAADLKSKLAHSST
jgi:hypothetical protein